MVTKNHGIKVLILIGMILLWIGAWQDAMAERDSDTPRILLLNSNVGIEKYKVVQEEFIKNIALPFEAVDLAGGALEETASEQLSGYHPEIVYCIGGRAYSYAKKHYNHQKIVFSSIMNWLRLPITSKTYGISNELHTRLPMFMVRSIFPTVQRIGILYSQKYFRQWVEGAIAQAKELGIEIIGKVVADSAKSLTSLNSLFKEVDAIWIIPDPVVMPDKEFLYRILNACDEKQVPVFSYHRAFSTSGAVLVVSADNPTIGRQAAGVTQDLVADQAPGEKVQYPAGSHITLNLTKINEYGLDYNPDALRVVNTIIREGDAETFLEASQNADQEINLEFQWLKEEADVTFVITASRVLEDIRKSAASITVIKENKIRQMGARNLMDVLRTVPGMSYWYDADGVYKIDARGIAKTGGQHILFMVNSHPLNSHFQGGANTLHDMIVDNIKQVEIIRGPGSAMYGANAFSGVINVITKTAAQIDGWALTTGVGSFNTQKYNLLGGEIFGDLEIAMNLNSTYTDGFKPFIEADTQSSLDHIFGTEASLAPGRAQAMQEKYDAALTLRFKGFVLDTRYIDSKKDMSIGPLGTLNDKNRYAPKDYFVNAHYTEKVSTALEVSGKLYRNYNYYHSFLKGFPKGSTAFTPEGMIVLGEDLSAEFSNKNIRTGAEIQATYQVTPENTVVTGVTYEKMKQYDITYAVNFLYTPVVGVILPLPDFGPVAEDESILGPADREFKAVFFQDIWDIREDLRLTIGSRYDHYSDFGGSLNPRAGISWEFIEDSDLKILYGRAFRAPSFQELYLANNPAQLGNPDLKPEKVNTYEVGLGHRFFKRLESRMTFFRNDVKDSIQMARNDGQASFQNSNTLRSQGIETELTYNFFKECYLGGNYTFQEAENLDTKERLWYAPKHKGNLMFNLPIRGDYNFYAEYTFQKGFKRQSDDTREDNQGYGIVNTTLLGNFSLTGIGTCQLRGSIYNLFDTHDASPMAKNSLPKDLPLPERSFFVELKYIF